MQHLRTASSCQASNEASVTRTPLSHKSLPNLPFEVIRRIIHHRLALPDSVPDAIPLSPASGSTERWDDLAGHAGRLSAKEKQKERREVMRDAGGMMLVCKAWKVCILCLTGDFHGKATGEAERSGGRLGGRGAPKRGVCGSRRAVTKLRHPHAHRGLCSALD